MKKLIALTCVFIGSSFLTGCLLTKDPEFLDVKCSAVECGTTVVNGDEYDCGICGGVTEYCSEEGQCIDDCSTRECGTSPEGMNCGTCSNELFYCNSEGQCIDTCADRDCGIAEDGKDCGECEGDILYCDSEGQCIDTCADRDCGIAEDDRDCGECEGPTDFCDSLGQCVDDCAGFECGESLNGFDCGECSGDTIMCQDNMCVDDCEDLECGLSPYLGVSCGTCSGATPFCVENMCSDVPAVCDLSWGRHDEIGNVCWQHPGATSVFAWSDAGTYCDTLELAGHSDWTLPKAEDFIDILDGCSSSDVFSWEDCRSCKDSTRCKAAFGNGFSDSATYWSSTFYSATNDAYFYRFSGTIDKDEPYVEHSVRCIRSTQ